MRVLFFVGLIVLWGGVVSAAQAQEGILDASSLRLDIGNQAIDGLLVQLNSVEGLAELVPLADSSEGTSGVKSAVKSDSNPVQGSYDLGAWLAKHWPYVVSVGVLTALISGYLITRDQIGGDSSDHTRIAVRFGRQ